MTIVSQLSRELLTIASLGIGSKKTRERFHMRIEGMNLTRIQNKRSHFCVYFVPVKETADGYTVLIGYHKKAKQYLAPGGHIEHDPELGRDERCIETLHREFLEEFGVKLPSGFSINPFWISITKIKNEIQACREHFDIWYAIDASDMDLNENPEFEQANWIPIAQVKEYIRDPASIEAFAALSRYLKNTQLEQVS